MAAEFLPPSELSRLMRIWFWRQVVASQLPPTNKRILSHYACTIDRVIRIDQKSLAFAIDLAARYDNCAPPEVVRELVEAATKSPAAGRREAVSATDVLKALLARIVYGGQTPDRVYIQATALYVLDFLHEWYRSQAGSSPGQVGGAPAIIADVLTQIGEPNVVFWTPYLSQAQARLFNAKTKYLTLDKECHWQVLPVHAAARPDDPTIINYSMEFAKGTSLKLEAQGEVLWEGVVQTSDRVIAVAPGYRYYTDSGEVDLSRSQNFDPHFEHILAADIHTGPTCAEPVAEDYPYWILGGIQSLSDKREKQAVETALQQARPHVTLHVEIASPALLPWFQCIVKEYVHSIGVNYDDVVGFADAVRQNLAATGERRMIPFPEPLDEDSEVAHVEYILDLGMWLASVLALDRIYIHSLTVDLVIRRCVEGQATDEHLDREVLADLYAKTVVTNRALSVDIGSSPDIDLGFAMSKFKVFIDLLARRAFPLEKGTIAFRGLPRFKAIAARGWFDDDARTYRIGVIPVALFQIEPSGLKFVGAGDTTSATSFIYGCFTRTPQP